MRGSWYSERAEFVWSEQTLDTRQVSTIMYLVIHAVFTVMVSHESGTINKLIWLISVCAGEERKKQNKKQNIISAAKNNIPKAITASIIDNFRCRAVIRWLSGLKQKRGERIFFFFSLMLSVLTIWKQLHERALWWETDWRRMRKKKMLPSMRFLGGCLHFEVRIGSRESKREIGGKRKKSGHMRETCCVPLLHTACFFTSLFSCPSLD